jgi:rubrerythrin
MTARHAFTSLRDFYAHALAIEREASHRYMDLAQEMQTHNNLAVAETFERLARMEIDHVEEITHAAPDVDTSTIPGWEYQWEGAESPEVTPLSAVHRLLTPFQALELALKNEERALHFFETVRRSSPNHEVRALAEAFAADERLHIEQVKAALARADRPSLGVDHDLDPLGDLN